MALLQETTRGHDEIVSLAICRHNLDHRVQSYVSLVQKMVNLLKNTKIKDILVIAAAVIVLTVPFINQPFNQDDRDFVEFARASATDITNLRLAAMNVVHSRHD